MPAIASDPPVLHSVPLDVAEFVIPDFRPGVDMCRIALADPAPEFDAVADAGGVRFLFLDGGSYLEVIFPGLGAPPFADTVVTGPAFGAAGARLSDLVAAPDRSSPGAGPDRFGSAAFHRFDARRDVVEIWVPEACVPPDVAVRPSADGRDGEVLIGGRPAARLVGAPEAGPRNVLILRRAPDGSQGAFSQNCGVTA